MEGIPEWSALKDVLVVVKSRCLEMSDQIFRADLVEQMRARGLRTRTKAGRKLKKSELRCKLQSSSVMPSVEARRSRKRKARNWYDLAQEMKNRGGNPRPRVNGKRVCLARSQLTQWLVRHSEVHSVIRPGWGIKRMITTSVDAQVKQRRRVNTVSEDATVVTMPRSHCLQ